MAEVIECGREGCSRPAINIVSVFFPGPELHHETDAYACDDCVKLPRVLKIGELAGAREASEAAKKGGE